VVNALALSTAQPQQASAQQPPGLMQRNIANMYSIHSKDTQDYDLCCQIAPSENTVALLYSCMCILLLYMQPQNIPVSHLLTVQGAAKKYCTTENATYQSRL